MRKRSSSPTYERWKAQVPILYERFDEHRHDRPSPCCQWGIQLKETKDEKHQRLYFSEQTDGKVPNTLVVANVEVFKSRVAAADHLSQFNEACSPFLKKEKAIAHPGKVLIWDIDAQPNHHAVHDAAGSKPTLILEGHTQNAEYALSMCHTDSLVLSGGQDTMVLLWSIQDYMSTLGGTASAKSPAALSENSSGQQAVEARNDKGMEAPMVAPRGCFRGHNGAVEDVQFCPFSEQEFCSVGDDSCLKFWDARTGDRPTTSVEKACHGHMYCVDWNPHDVNLIVTGSADSFVRMFDYRKIDGGSCITALHRLKGHKDSVLRVQWSPNKASVFGSAAKDGFLNVWDHEKVGKKVSTGGLRMVQTPAGLIFQHAGHRGGKVTDFNWSISDPWTIASVSTDSGSNPGGSLQIWCMSDLIHRPTEEVLEELNRFKDHISSCG
ncbi:WD-40 repeat-containing protein MSI4-like isoform X2 [Asparagus officinalis]|uniref:WD-40 repeat-containing protein MSI4-like isoform X2 n=1 Tax=Asparagus officinalis TaxID=4686 RepID=UPI00098E7784|nr:WD-40 repeat-containing protein MSI4-like isoform X2 [Asparagus officinalis]